MSTVQGRILIAEDDHEMAQLLGCLLHREGLTPLLAKDGIEALQLVRAADPDVLLADLRMPGMDGMELMRKAKDLDPELPVVLITAFAEVRGAVDAIHAGAHDYLAKPFEHRQVIRVVLRALNERRLKLQLKQLADHVHQALSPRETFGPSEAVGKVIAAIERVANSNFSVLIVGETGSGKEVVARAIHQASGRARHPFIPVDCGAIPEMLFESELFGHERGAFTGADRQTIGKIEAAHGGTLFLDEISNIELSKSIKGFSPPAIEMMLAYDWPGNVRQLRSAVRRAVLMAEDVVTEEDLGLKPKACELLAEDELVVHASAHGRVSGDLALREIVRSSTVHVERVAITHALRRTGGNKSKAARLLQVDYKTLHSKVKEYGIQIEGEQLHDQETQ